MKSLRFFAKMIRKTFFVLMATVVANASFVYCYDGRPRALPTKKYPSYLTSEQKDTLDTIRDVSGDNRLYEMDCTFDYKLDDLLSSMDRNVQNTNSLIKSIILPKSTKPAPIAHIKGNQIACSTFSTKSSDGHTIFGRNYDFIKRDGVCIIVHTHPKNGYASVGVADLGFFSDGVASPESFKHDNLEYALYSPFWVMDGINEKGFSVGMLIVHGETTNMNNNKPPLNTLLVCRYLLDKASSVNEAIELLNRIDLISSMQKLDSDVHWIISDASGEKAIIEVVNNEISVAERKKYDESTVCTNFYLSQNANDSCPICGAWRYDMIKTWLKHVPHPSRETVMNMLQSVRASTDKISFTLSKDGCITLWSEIFDCNDKTMDLCFMEKYDKTYRFGIDYQLDNATNSRNR